MELETSMEKDMLYGLFKGQFTLEESKRTFLQLIDEVKTSRAVKVLIDGRKVTGQPTTMERFYYGEFCAKEVSKLASLESLTPTFAFTLIEPLLDPGRFGENVAVNRGMKVKMFDNINDARSWLEQMK
ncbi:MAG: hypothetical protein ABI763_00180 [Bacteroidota bacterium]